MSRYIDSKESFLEPKVNQYGGHMVQTDVHKPTKHKYVNIDTRFCDEYAQVGTASYTITLPQRITEVKSIMICNLELPMSISNISSAIGNNAFIVDASLIVIPDGFYSDPSFVVLNNPRYYSIKDKINSLLTVANTKLTYDISYNHSIFTNTDTVNNHSVKFDVNYAGYDRYLYKSRLGWLLGYHDSGGTYDISFTIPSNSGSNINTLVSDSLVNLNGPRYLYLVIDEFSNSFQNSFWAPISNYIINKNIIARISLNPGVISYGSVLSANNFNGLLLSDRRSYNGKVDIQKLSIQLIDEFGSPVSLNGDNFSFCMEVEYE
jgi:hypothetical protein